MNEKEEKKYLIIGQIMDGLITKKDAGEKLNVSIRQINRLIIKYKEEGKNGFIHKNKGKTPHQKIEENIKKEIVNLYLKEYYDYNFSHYYEDVIKNKYDVSFAMLKIILTEEDIISPLAQRKTKNEYHKKMREKTKNKTISEESKYLYETRKIQEEQAHTRRSNLYLKFGEELQMDASEYVWFGEITTHLHLIVDKATKIILFGWFDYQETMRTYFILLFNALYMYGIPRKIRTDRRKVFDDNNGEKTHFGRICNELNIELHSSSNPRFKPNVERENKTFKGRLKAELRHEGITTIEAANLYLNDVFIPKMNSRFAFRIEEEKSLMRKNNYTIEELVLLISEKYSRTIDTGSCLKYKGKYYIPVDKDKNEVYFKNKTPAILIIDYNNELRCLIEQNYYKLKEIKKQEYNKTIATSEIQMEILKERKQYVPPKNHPWKRTFKF